MPSAKGLPVPLTPQVRRFQRIWPVLLGCLVLVSSFADATGTSAVAGSCTTRERCGGPAQRWTPSGRLSFSIDYSRALTRGTLNTTRSDVYILPLHLVAEAAGDGGRGAAKLEELTCRRGKKLVCYTNCGAYEPGHWNEGLIGENRDHLLGGPMAGYPEERWLDIRRLDLLRPLVREKFGRAAALGCDALACDNTEAWITGTDGKDGEALDLYRNRGLDALRQLAARHVRQRTGLDISYADQIAFNRMLAEEAHGACLGIGLINDVFQITDLAPDFDFAINEQCHHCGWCDLYAPFVAAGKPVFHIEFDDNEGFCRGGTTPIRKICSDIKTQRLTTFSTVKRLASSKLHTADAPRTCK